MKQRIRPLRLVLSHPLIFGEVVMRSALISAALRFASLARISSYCARPRRFRRAAGIDPQLVHGFSLALERRLPGRASCLRSSLVLFSMSPARARWLIGVDKAKGELEAHAWVETESAVFSGSVDWDRYRAILSVRK
jgi:hypothetical protein